MKPVSLEDENWLGLAWFGLVGLTAILFHFFALKGDTTASYTYVHTNVASLD